MIGSGVDLILCSTPSKDLMPDSSHPMTGNTAVATVSLNSILRTAQETRDQVIELKGEMNRFIAIETQMTNIVAEIKADRVRKEADHKEIDQDIDELRSAHQKLEREVAGHRVVFGLVVTGLGVAISRVFGLI